MSEHYEKRCDEILTINKGQSNLAIDGIAANWGFRPPNIPFPWGTGANV